MAKHSSLPPTASQKPTSGPEQRAALSREGMGTAASPAKSFGITDSRPRKKQQLPSTSPTNRRLWISLADGASHRLIFPLPTPHLGWDYLANDEDPTREPSGCLTTRCSG